MEVLKRVINPLKWFRRTCEEKKCVVLSPEEKLSLKLKPYKSYLFKLQELLIWKEPKNSLIFVASVHLLFLVWIWMQWRFYGALFTTILALVIYECWFDWIWPEIRVEREELQSPPPTSDETNCDQEGMLSIPELSKVVTFIQAVTKDWFAKTMIFRSKHPTMFLSAGCTTCLILAKLGAIVPGILLLYMLVMGTILLPGVIIHYVPKETKEKLVASVTRIAAVVRPPDSPAGDDEYLPEVTKETMSLLNFASGEFVQSGSAGPGYIEPVLPPEDPIPNFDESSMETDSFALDTLPPELSFKPTHFNGASSALGAALSKALTETLGSALISGASLAKSTASSVQQIPDDSDSEFELIDPEEEGT